MPENNLLDHSETARFLYPGVLTDGCQIMLDDRQFMVLIDILDRVIEIGDIGFRLEACIDHRPGHTLSWDNGGTREQDRQVDRLMDELAAKLFNG